MDWVRAAERQLSAESDAEMLADKISKSLGATDKSSKKKGCLSGCWLRTIMFILILYFVIMSLGFGVCTLINSVLSLFGFMDSSLIFIEAANSVHKGNVFVGDCLTGMVSTIGESLDEMTLISKAKDTCKEYLISEGIVKKDEKNLFSHCVDIDILKKKKFDVCIDDYDSVVNIWTILEVLKDIEPSLEDEFCQALYVYDSKGNVYTINSYRELVKIVGFNYEYQLDEFVKKFIVENGSLETDSLVVSGSDGEELLSEDLVIAKNNAIKMMQKDKIAIISKDGKIIDFTEKGFLQMNLSLYSSDELSQKACIYAIELAIRELAVQEGYNVDEVVDAYYKAIRKGPKGSTEYFSGKSDYYKWSEFDMQEVVSEIGRQRGAVVQFNSVSDFHRLSSDSSSLPYAFYWQGIVDAKKEAGQQQHMNMVAKSEGSACAKILAPHYGRRYR